MHEGHWPPEGGERSVLKLWKVVVWVLRGVVLHVARGKHIAGDGSKLEGGKGYEV